MVNKNVIKEIKTKAYALNSNTRIEILFLCQDKELTITQIAKKLNLSLNNTSQNISILERAQLVEKTKHKNSTVSVRSIVKITQSKLEW